MRLLPSYWFMEMFLLDSFYAPYYDFNAFLYQVDLLTNRIYIDLGVSSSQVRSVIFT